MGCGSYGELAPKASGKIREGECRCHSAQTDIRSDGLTVPVAEVRSSDEHIPVSKDIDRVYFPLAEPLQPWDPQTPGHLQVDVGSRGQDLIEGLRH